MEAISMKTIPILGTRRFVLAIILGIGLGFVFPAIADTSVIVNPDGKLIYLGTLGGNSTVATDINDAGQVVGYSFTTANNFDSRHAFITGPDGRGMTDLGTLGGDYSKAFGINAAGRVVGVSLTAEGVRHAFITGPNGIGMTDLGALGGTSSFATDINDAGQVVGGSDGRAFITGPNGEGMTYLAALLPQEASSFATGINNAGQVVGRSLGEYESGARPRGRYIHAFMTGPGGMGMRDLGAPQGSGTSATAINDAGQVVGDLISSALGAPPLGFITGPDGTGMTWLAWPDGWWGNNVTDINDAGQLVGYSFLFRRDYYPPHAYITGPDGEGMTDLNSLVDLPDGHYLSSADGINNLGQVIATLSPIPEPASYALMLAGLGLVGFVVRRKKPEEMRLNIVEPVK